MLAWALTHSMVNSPNLMQGEVKFWSENTRYTESMIKKKKKKNWDNVCVSHLSGIQTLSDPV